MLELSSSGPGVPRKIAKQATTPTTSPGSVPKTSESNPKRLDLEFEHRAASPRSTPSHVTFSDPGFNHSTEQSDIRRKSWAELTSTSFARSGQKGGLKHRQGESKELGRELTHPKTVSSSSLATFCQHTVDVFSSRASSLQSIWSEIKFYLAWALGTFLFFLAFFLIVAAWVQWAHNWTPRFLQKPLRKGTDFGSRVICSAPGMGNVCLLVCRWADYSEIFPTVCQGKYTGTDSASFDDIFRETYSNFSQSLGLNGRMYSAPKKLKDHRNAMFLHLDQIKEIHGTGEVKDVDFDKLENMTQTVLDLMHNVPEDFYVFLNHVGVIPDTVLFQTGATRVMIEAILKNESATHHSQDGLRRKTTPQALPQKRFLTHMREWRIMVERLIEPGRSIKMRFHKIEDKCLSMKGSIKTAITQMMDQKDSKMGLWALWKRLGMHFKVYKPREIRYLLNALDEVEDLDTVVKDLSKLFADLWTNTMAINTNLDNLIDKLRKGSDLLFSDGDDRGERLMSLLGNLEKSAKDVQDAHDSVDGKPSSPFEDGKVSSIS